MSEYVVFVIVDCFLCVVVAEALALASMPSLAWSVSQVVCRLTAELER